MSREYTVGPVTEAEKAKARNAELQNQMAEALYWLNGGDTEAAKSALVMRPDEERRVFKTGQEAVDYLMSDEDGR